MLRRTNVGTLPADSDAAYWPVVLTTDGELIAADVYAIRYLAAAGGDVIADGNLAEWNDSDWSAVALTPKSRLNPTVNAPTTQPSKPADIRFAVRTGASALHLAFMADASAERDSFALFFDPRSTDELGTVGPYFWIDCELQPNGAMKLRKGETSPKSLDAKELRGAWRRDDSGKIHVELTLPYAIYRGDRWPAAGDLGMGVVWNHRLDASEKPAIQRYFWSDNAHWWTPVGYGVVRLQADAQRAPMPWLVRVR
jgi:hypothetical protein